jgi:hypothetical protein
VNMRATTKLLLGSLSESPGKRKFAVADYPGVSRTLLWRFRLACLMTGMSGVAFFRALGNPHRACGDHTARRARVVWNA